MINNHRSANSGFTLIETIIAIAFFSIVSMAIFTLVLQTAGSNQRARNMCRAEALAVTHAERFKGLSIDDPLLTQTVTAAISFSAPFRVETVIKDDIPIIKSPGPTGEEQTVSKLIEISVFKNEADKSCGNNNRLAVLHLIKTRSL